ncbi:MAG: hypothetical protein ACRDJ5_01415, partial [Actinomycetota bacterium]
MSERTRVSVTPRASLSERNAGGAWARLVGLGVLQGLIASLLSVLVALGVDALMPEGAASSVGVAALICAGLVAAFASAAWVRSRELFEQRSVGEIHADHVRGVILERLQELPASAPERTAASSSLHRFRRHLAAVSDWGATGYAGMVTTAAALASAGLTLGLWAPLASLFAVLLVVAMLAGALAHG